MPSTAPLLVFVTMFAANEAGGIQAFHLDTATGTLTPAAFTADCPNGFFLTLAPDRRTVYSLTAKKFGAADTEEVLAWRIADRDGRLEPLGRRSANGPATCYVAADPQGRSLLLAHYSGATVAWLPLGPDGSLAGDPVAVRHEGTGPDAGRQEAPHPHAIVPAPAVPNAPQVVYAADLGADAIFAYRLDVATGGLVVNEPPLVKTHGTSHFIPTAGGSMRSTSSTTPSPSTTSMQPRAGSSSGRSFRRCRQTSRARPLPPT